MSKKDNSGCFLAIAALSVLLLGFVLFGNVVDNSQNKKGTGAAAPFAFFIIALLAYFIYIVTKKKE
jgi:Na+-transporting NADH:ubiquinone oxidoreductase subunit NqrD